jgi:hypothetical protein
LPKDVDEAQLFHLIRRKGMYPATPYKLAQEEAIMRTNPFRLGIILGLLLAIFNAFWAALAALGWAQPLMNFVFEGHFITPPWHIEAFRSGRANVLGGFTFLIGGMMDAMGGWLWNRFASVD